MSGRSQNEFCKLIEVSKGYMTHLKAVGRIYDPRYSFLLKLVEALRLNPHWLYDPDKLPHQFFNEHRYSSVPDWVEDYTNYKKVRENQKFLLENERQTLKWLVKILNMPDKDKDTLWEKEVLEIIRAFLKPIDV